MLIHWIWLATRPGVSDRQKKLLLESCIPNGENLELINVLKLLLN